MRQNMAACPRLRGAFTVKFEVHPGVLVLHWLEHGGPQVRVPKANGFGTTLISISMKNLQGEAEFNWDHGGMKCKLTLPREEASWEGRSKPACRGNR